MGQRAASWFLSNLPIYLSIICKLSVNFNDLTYYFYEQPGHRRTLDTSRQCQRLRSVSTVDQCMLRTTLQLHRMKVRI